MQSLHDQIRILEISIRRQRRALVALASVVVGGGLVGAARMAADASFDKITCKEWAVVDKDGVERISALTIPNGQAVLTWYDKDGRKRIVSGTGGSGNCTVQWFDKDGKTRIQAGITNTNAASVMWLDKDEKPRIAAGIGADGTVVYPQEGGK